MLGFVCVLGEALINGSTNKNSTIIPCKSWVYEGVERSAVTEVSLAKALLFNDERKIGDAKLTIWQSCCTVLVHDKSVAYTTLG